MSLKQLLAAGTAVASLLVVTGASPAHAIVYGVPTDDYANVGSLVIERPVDGAIFQLCTGTVIAPKVVVTASHCLVGLPEGWPIGFTLDSVIDDGPDGPDGLVDEDVDIIWDPTPHAHDLFATGGANNTYDIGALVFDEPLDAEPATLPTLGLLDSMAAKGDTYTAVGYGTVRTSKKTGWQGIGDSTGRMMATQTVNSVTKSWITFSMNQATGNGGTCYGDSGGPHFDADRVIVALTVTGDSQCKSTDKSYRLDTADARDFLDPILAAAEGS